MSRTTQRWSPPLKSKSLNKGFAASAASEDAEAQAIRTLWKSRYREIYEFYCPVCGAAKRLPFKPRPSRRHYAQIALTTAMLMLAAWPLFGAKGVVIFVPLWAGFETFYRLRARAKMRCDSCAFDPYLYLVDAKKARGEIDAHFKKMFEARGLAFPPPKKAGTMGQIEIEAKIRVKAKAADSGSKQPKAET